MIKCPSRRLTSTAGHSASGPFSTRPGEAGGKRGVFSGHESLGGVFLRKHVCVHEVTVATFFESDGLQQDRALSRRVNKQDGMIPAARSVL